MNPHTTTASDEDDGSRAYAVTVMGEDAVRGLEAQTIAAHRDLGAATLHRIGISLEALAEAGLISPEALR